MEDSKPEQAKFPWKAFAQNVGVIGGAHLLGRLGGGLAVRALAQTPIGRRFGGLPPQTQSNVASRIGDAFTVGAALALRAQDLAAQARIDDAVDERLRSLENRTEKKASVYAAYTVALRTL